MKRQCPIWRQGYDGDAISSLPDRDSWRQTTPRLFEAGVPAPFEFQHHEGAARLASSILIDEFALRQLFCGGDAEHVSGQRFDLFLILLGELLVRLARGLGRGGFGTASLDLLAMKQIVEVHGPSPAD